MNNSVSTLNALLELYPNADEILSKIGDIEPDKAINPQGDYNDSTRPHDIIQSISFFLKPFPEKESIYPVLCDNLHSCFHEKIRNITCNYKHIINNEKRLSKDLAQQCINSLPAVVEKLCFFCTRLNQSEQHRIGNWQDMFKTYAILTQQIELHQSHTIEVIKNILSRLDCDQKQLKKTFHISEFTITSLVLFLGDFHESGKSVIKVNFPRVSLIYKPRRADNETLLSNMMADLFKGNEESMPGVPECITIDNYSWHKCIHFTNAKNKAEVISYYHKIGLSLALFFFINGYDFHFENIIYSSGTPYFIDLECVFTCSFFTDIISNSILSTLIIPSLQGNASDALICGIGTSDIIVKKMNIEINEQGNIHFKENRVKIEDKYNVPTHDYDKKGINLASTIKNGFDEMVFLLRGNNIVMKTLRKVKSLRSRMLFRTSKLYADIITVSNHPAYSTNPPLRNMYIACALYNEDIPIDVIRHEYLSLIEGRIPAFYVDIINGRCYSFTGEEVNAEGKILSRKEFMSKVFSVYNEEVVELQRKLLDVSLHTIFPQKVDHVKNIDSLDLLVDFMATKTCHHNSHDIYLNLKREKGDSRAISIMRQDLYSGLGGAMFLQICNFIFKRTTYNEFKLKRLLKLNTETEPDKYFGCFDSSSGSLLYIEYLLVKHSTGIIDKFTFSNHLLRLVRIITNQNNANFDIINGIAGLLIVSCRMHTLSPSKTTELAIKILTKKLLSQAVMRDDHTMTWGRGWPGFSHGNAGIAYALTLANNVLNDRQVDNAIIKTLNYEKAFRIDSGWNGADIYDTGEDFNSWCHGAPGIYLSRVAIRKEMNRKNSEIEDILHSDIEHYHNTMANRPLNDHHSLCHGMFGNAIIEPARYGTHFSTDEIKMNILEEKSLMLGEIGALYTNFYFSHRDYNIPNLLLLE